MCLWLRTLKPQGRNNSARSDYFTEADGSLRPSGGIQGYFGPPTVTPYVLSVAVLSSGGLVNKPYLVEVKFKTLVR